jgi:hypothetical protein
LNRICTPNPRLINSHTNPERDDNDALAVQPLKIPTTIFPLKNPQKKTKKSAIRTNQFALQNSCYTLAISKYVAYHNSKDKNETAKEDKASFTARRLPD